MQKKLLAIAILVILLIPGISHSGGLDARYASIDCTANASEGLMKCNYRYAPTIAIKDIFLKVNGRPVQIPEKGMTSYPSEGQKTSILFLADISDPSRRNTVEKIYARDISEMLSAKKPYEEIGLAVFDSDMEVLAPISANVEVVLNALGSIKATGQATEFYKNIIAAIDVLKKSEGSRKGLIILSDGKDEDRAYRSDDVLKAAREANVSILSLGYAEKQSDLPSLQTLKKLADDTYGLYVNVSNKRLPADLVQRPFSFVEKGGEISFDSTPFRGAQTISLEMNADTPNPIIVSTTADFSVGRSYWRRSLDLLMHFWWIFLLSLAMLAAVIVGIKRFKNKSSPVEYAFLDEMNGEGTRYSITKTASRIGRGADNDIRLVNDSISSHHAEIHRRREGGFYIVDLASTNGVFVNENKITQTELSNGDLVELGEVRLHFIINN